MRHDSSTPRIYFEVLLVATILGFFTRTFLVQAFVVPTASMEKSLRIGDHILVNKFIYGDSRWAWPLPVRAVRRGDIVLFRLLKNPREIYIKRCVALAGDTVEIVDRGLVINGRPQDETGYAYDSRSKAATSTADSESQTYDLAPYSVPSGHIFCLGDNRAHSSDSRLWGAIPIASIRGRASIIYWSYDETMPAGGGSAWVRLRRTHAVRFLTNTRWDRSLMLVR